MRTGRLWELAAMADMPSQVTLRTFIRSQPDFPVLQLGGRGKSYLLDLDAAAAFVRANWQDSRAERSGVSPTMDEAALAPSEQRVGALWELAALPGMPSQPTLRAFMSVRPDFPVLRHGSRGVSFLIDLNAAAAFVRAHWRDSRSDADDVACVKGGKPATASGATTPRQQMLPGLFACDDEQASGA